MSFTAAGETIVPSGLDIPLDSPVLATGSDNPDHRKRLTQPQDVISTETVNEAFPFYLRR